MKQQQEDSTPEILVAAGPQRGRRFAVSSQGLRLGRSSSCEISLADPALSRNHCLFERRDGALWVTDLASANGTLVNGVALGSGSRRLAAGDVVDASGVRLAIVAPGAPAPVLPPRPGAAGAFDFGLVDAARPEGAGRAGALLGRLLLWAAAVGAGAGVAALIRAGVR